MKNKKRTLILTLIILLGLTLWTQLSEAGEDVTFTWDPYTDNEPVVGFKLYMAIAPNVQPVLSNLAATIPGKETVRFVQVAVPSGMKYWVLTAFTPTEESRPSNEVSYRVKLKPPSGLSNSVTVSFSDMRVTITRK